MKGYAHIEIVDALLIVNMLTCLSIASHDVRVMTWEFGEMLLGHACVSLGKCLGLFEDVLDSVGKAVGGNQHQRTN